MNKSVSRTTGLIGVALAFGFVSGCSGGDASPPQKQELELATGSTCPDIQNPPVTYSGWAENFFASYCTRCHSSTLTTTEERNGATPHANWDDLPTIRSYAQEIDSYAAGGPNGINHIMPPSDPTPTDDERIMLGEFLACDAPE
ncbi:MAG TPA: hypothetical protein VMI54_12130 [Polyangiaceae bacterium]|nr:hypothetical protein [Polyangiaceae bacterium]